MGKSRNARRAPPPPRVADAHLALLRNTLRDESGNDRDILAQHCPAFLAFTPKGASESSGRGPLVLRQMPGRDGKGSRRQLTAAAALMATDTGQ